MQQRQVRVSTASRQVVDITDEVAKFGVIGLINLGSTAINQLLNATPAYSNVRDAYAGFGAVILVGLPVWGVHWWLAQRFAARNADERASAIRQLYLYVVLTATGIALAVYLRRLIEDTTGVLLGSSSDGASITRALWAALVLATFWIYHFRTASLDRSRAGESGVSATLRRWYAYGLLFLGLAFLLFGARNLLQQIWVLLVDRGQVIAPGGLVPTALATMLTGLVICGFHSQWTARPPIAEDDQRSVADVDDAHDTEDQSEAGRHQRVYAAGQDAEDGRLQDQGHVVRSLSHPWVRWREAPDGRPRPEPT